MSSPDITAAEIEAVNQVLRPPYLSIGPWSVIGAGTVVVRDTPANVTAVGVPVKVIKTREEGSYER